MTNTGAKVVLNTGFKALLIGLLLIAVYALWWTATFVLYYSFHITVPATVVDRVMYVLFWIGVGFFAGGVAVIVLAVAVEAKAYIRRKK